MRKQKREKEINITGNTVFKAVMILSALFLTVKMVIDGLNGVDVDTSRMLPLIMMNVCLYVAMTEEEKKRREKINVRG